MATPTLTEKLARARARRDLAEATAAQAAVSHQAEPAGPPRQLHPHQRRPEAGPRPQCIAINRVNGQRCKRRITSGRTKLCKLHLALAKRSPEFSPEALAMPPTTGPSRPESIRGKPHNTSGSMPDPSPADTVKRGITTSVTRQAKSAVRTAQADRTLTAQASGARHLVSRRASATAVVINQQSRAALAKLGMPYDPTALHEDPKQVLLALVASAHQQSQVWAAMLASIPEEDFDMIGVTPIPGNPASSKGTRIEAIQKFLDQSTKTAARISKMAIDAGIEERLVRLAEEQQAMIADTVRAGLVAAIADLVRLYHWSQADEAKALDAALAGAAHHLQRLAAGTPEEVVEGVTTVIERAKKTAPVAAAYRARQKAKEGELVLSDDDDAESDLASTPSGHARQVNPDYEDE